MTIIPDHYKSILNVRQTQMAIEKLKEIFASNLRNNLNLKRASAPLFLEKDSGLNDDLAGTSEALSFSPPAAPDTRIEIVQSLAKWKRYVLKNYGFKIGEGIVTDMNAIRKHEDLDNTHSIYVDQWDWELILDPSQRDMDFLKSTVAKIVDAISKTSRDLQELYNGLPDYNFNPDDLSFITSQELEDLFPNESPEKREYLYTKKHPISFVMCIGEKLRSGQVHGFRASDYDDWSLNGDLLIYDKLFDRVIELSSMGIRVDKNSLARQLKISNEESKSKLPYHKAILNDELDLTIGGGIGQSRLSMVLLGKVHIGEVQSSVWDKYTLDICSRKNVPLL